MVTLLIIVAYTMGGYINKLSC